MFRPAGLVWLQGLYAQSNFRDLPGFWTFGDDNLGGQYSGWHKGHNGVYPGVWALQSMPNEHCRALGVQLYDAPEGPGLREFGVTFHGPPGSGYVVSTLAQAFVDGRPHAVRRGQRLVGDRFEPPGGYLAGGMRYVGKMCTTAGWDGEVRQNNTPYTQPTLQMQAHTIVPSTPTGYVYLCTKGGTSGAAPPSTWPATTASVVAYTWRPNTTVNAGDYMRPDPPNGRVYKCITAGTTNSTQPTGGWPTGTSATDGTAVWTDAGADDASTWILDGRVIWTRIGPLAVYQYYGACV